MMTNASVVSADEISIAEGRGRWVVMVLAAVEHVLVAAMVGILTLVPDVPYNVSIRIAREHYKKSKAIRSQRTEALASMTTS